MATGGGDANLSEEVFDVVCSICSRKRLIKEAVKYCSDCSRNLCDNCSRIHVKHIPDHTLVDCLGEEEEEASVLTEKCSEHKTEFIKYFCGKHNVLLCSICALLRHKQCENLRYISQSAEDLGKDMEIQRVPEHLTEAMKLMEEIVKSLNRYMEGQLEKEDKVLEQIEHFAKRLIETLKEMKENSRSEVTAKCQQQITEATQVRDACIAAKSDMDKLVHAIQQTDAKQAQLFILSKKGQAKMKMVEELTTKAKTLINNSKLAFRAHCEIEDQIDTFSELGTVVSYESYKVFQKDMINVRMKLDTNKCSISGVCLLPDGTLVLGDNSNNRLKHVDPSTGSVICQTDLERIRGVTCINQNEVVVSDGSRDVRVVSLSNNMKITRTLTLNHNCIHISYNSGELIITDVNCLYVHTLTGSLIRSFITDEAGENMFVNITGIAVNQDGGRIYVADWIKGLVCVNRAGIIIFRWSAEELGQSFLRDVCLAQGSTVLVCGLSSSNVVQVSDDGRVIGEILTSLHEDEESSTMCFDATKHMLYVCFGYVYDTFTALWVYHLS